MPACTLSSEAWVLMSDAAFDAIEHLVRRWARRGDDASSAAVCVVVCSWVPGLDRYRSWDVGRRMPRRSAPLWPSGAIQRRRGLHRRPAQGDGGGTHDVASSGRAVPDAHRALRRSHQRDAGGQSQCACRKPTRATGSALEGKVRGPLHGIPIALKDNVHTTDMPTTGGAVAFEGLMPPYDATLTKNLRDAGAIILAKTNMTELANWVAGGPTPMPGNYNGLGGYGLNPYDPRRDPREADRRRPPGARPRAARARAPARRRTSGRPTSAPKPRARF